MATAASSNKGLAVVSAGTFVHLIEGASRRVLTSVDVLPISAALPAAAAADGTPKPEQLKFHDNFQVLATAFSNDGASVAVGTSAKTVVIFGVEGESLVERRTFRIPKTPTALAFDRADAAIVVADRAGVVRKYAVAAPAAKENQQHVDDDDEDERDFEGEFVASAISMMLDVRFSACGKFLLVTDRDEKLRVHRYPQTFVLHSLCLGHKDYVNTVVTAKVGGEQLAFTAGGDGSVIAWDYASGAEKGRIAGLGAVRRLIVIVEEDASTRLLAVLNNSANITMLKAEASSGGGVTLTNEGTEGDIIDEGRIMDIVLVGEKMLVVSSAGLFMLSVSSPNYNENASLSLQTIALAEAHAATLGHLKDPLPDMTKKVAHDNMAEYLQRKEKKIQESRNKKRKNGNESGSEPPLKKVDEEHAEEEVVTVEE